MATQKEKRFIAKKRPVYIKKTERKKCNNDIKKGVGSVK